MRNLVLAGRLLFTGAGAQAQTPGDWALARYKGGPHYYPGIVRAFSAGMITIAYDDGDRETMPVGLTKPYDWQIGTRVECNFRGAGRWYPGAIASLGGTEIGINYDDGDKERTKTRWCRSQ